MGIVRDVGFTIPAMVETRLITCSAAYTTGTTGGVYNPGATGDLIVSTGVPVVVGGTSTVFGIAFGRIIDRLAAPFGAGFYVACPYAYIDSTAGSTEADRKIQVGCQLQHGDSSGGGDQVPYSSGRDPIVRNYFSSARTTDMLQWEVGGRSTGALYGVSNMCYYDLNAAKRYLRLVVYAGKDFVTTAANDKDEAARVGGTITFLAGDILSLPGEGGVAFAAGQPAFGGQGFLYALERNSPESSSTSTF